MSISNKTPSMQIYKLALFQKALHPELFKIQDRRLAPQAEYEVEVWALPGGHVLRFQTPTLCLTESVTHQDYPLPDRNVLHNLQCLGEREVDETIDGKVRYMASAQTELLSDNIYLATFNEMKAFVAEHKALKHEWSEADGTTSLSVVALQYFRKELHVQGWHMIGSAGFMLRTQSIFEIL